jgi:hypothetical protein
MQSIWNIILKSTYSLQKNKKFKWNTQWQHELRCKCHQHNASNEEGLYVNPFNFKCWNWGENDHMHMPSKSLNVHSPMYLPYWCIEYVTK